MGNTTVQGGGAHPTSHFSSTSISYRPSNASGLSNGGFGGNSGGSGDSIDLMDFIVTPDEMDIYEASEVTGSLGIKGAELPKPDTRPWYEKAWDSVVSAGATVVVGFTSALTGVIDIVDDIADAGAYLAAGVCTAFGDEESAQWLREQAAQDLGDNFNDALYGENGLIKGVNEASYMKYDSDMAQGIRKVSKEATKFAAEVALTATTGGAGAALFGGITAMGAAAENAYQNNGAQQLTLGENLRVLGAGAGGAVTGYFNGQMGLNALNGLKGIGSGSVRTFAKNAWTGLKNFDWATAGKAGLKTLGTGKTWGTAIGTSAEEIFNATANWVETGEFNGDDWLAVGGHVVKSVGFQSVMAFGTSGIQGGNVRYQEKLAQEAAERAEFNANLDNMTPEQRSQAWEEYYSSQYGAENVTHESGIGVSGSNGSFVDPDAAAINANLPVESFKTLSPEARSVAFDYLTPQQKYDIYKNDYVESHLRGLTPENADKYLTLNSEGNIDIDWPTHGGYQDGTIKAVDGLSGDYVLSRAGSKGGNCWGFHPDIPASDIALPSTDATISNVTMSQRAILQGDSVMQGTEGSFKCVFHADKYNETVKTLSGLGTKDPLTIEAKLISQGYTQTEATKLIQGYTNRIAGSEWSAPGNIYEGFAAQGQGGAVTGAYGTAASWQDLSGGAQQLTTQLPAYVMIETGIITDVTDGIPIKP